MDMEANQVDRISSLPEELIYYILSFMDMKQVVQLSTLSNRWGKLWSSTPYLNFNEYFWEDSWDVPEDSWDVATKKIWGTFKKAGRRHWFKELIERVLLNRDASSIQRLSLSASSYAGNPTLFEIDRWISYALQRRLHTLILDGYRIPLPKCLCFASNVKVVELLGVFLLSRNHGELALNLKVVETLVIQNCNHDNGDIKMLTISAPKLSCLRIVHGKYNNDCTLKVCAPNLESFRFKGQMYKSYAFENLSPLATVDVLGVDQFDKAMKTFLREFVHVNSLTVSHNGFQMFKKSENMLEETQSAFDNIKYLELIEWYSNYLIQPVVAYLQGFQGLETLVLKCFQGRYDPRTAEGNFGDCRFYRLKSIEYQEFDRCDRCNDEFRFLTFMLKNALMLEQINITSTTRSDGKKKKLVKFCLKLKSIPIASSSVTIMLNLPMRAKGPYYLVLQSTSP